MGIVAAYAVPHPPLIVPACGQGQERGIQATVDSFEEVARRIARHDPDTIVVTSPHAPMYYDCFAICPGPVLEGDFAQFRAPEEKVSARIDEEFAREVEQLAQRAMLPVMGRAWAGMPMDHATFIPLWFTGNAGVDCPVVACGLSGLSDRDHYALGQVIAQVAEDLDRRVVFVASGDWSHKLTPDGPYGFTPEGPMFDAKVAEAFRNNDMDALFHIDKFLVDVAAECGLRSFMIMAGALHGKQHTGELLSYEGPFGVGYGVAAFEVGEEG